MRMGFILLLIFLASEVGYLIFCLMKKDYSKGLRKSINLGLFAVIVLLMLFGIINWGFRWWLLLLILLLKVISAIIYLLKRNSRKEKTYSRRYVIMSIIGNILLFTFALLPAILFPQFSPIEVTGDKEVKIISYTWTDINRKETFSEKEEKRRVTVQFWYPEQEGSYPLLMFSHGSFGFRGSNLSTFEELASNGYVVGSIDHSYHAFFTKETDGNVIIANMDFINSAMTVTQGAYDEQKTHKLTQEWLKLRTEDMNFVLDTILDTVNQTSSDEVYHRINTEKIGLFGHSLGGATAAALGRSRTDIDSVIVVDGTMLGEESGFEGGKVILNDEAYPVPLLNLYNQEHYEEALRNPEQYANTAATAKAIDAREVVIKGSGHLNFTDLPMFSPFLARQLGTGEVDSRYCVKTMNYIILEYFNYYLKDAKTLNLKAEY